MDKEYFAKKLGEQFPEFHGAYQDGDPHDVLHIIVPVGVHVLQKVHVPADFFLLDFIILLSDHHVWTKETE